MSLYRQPGRVATRTLVLAALGALVAGAAIGFFAGRASKGEPSLRERIAEVRGALAPARDGLELVQTEYGQAVKGGRVVAATEYGAAKADIARARAAVTAHRDDLVAINAAAVRALDTSLGTLQSAVAGRQPPAQVTLAAQAAQQALDAITGRPA